jgi:hypothetical protein
VGPPERAIPAARKRLSAEVLCRGRLAVLDLGYLFSERIIKQLLGHRRGEELGDLRCLEKVLDPGW